MILKGYHGTSKSIAGIICQEQRFKESIGDKQWLGHGAYPIPKQSGLSYFRHKPMHIQICVKNETCICFETLEELSHDEYRRIREAMHQKN